MDQRKTIIGDLLRENAFLKKTVEQLTAEVRLLTSHLGLKSNMECGSFIMEDFRDAKSVSRRQTNLDEDHFQKRLKQSNTDAPFRTSSPVDFRSFIRGSRPMNEPTRVDCHHSDLSSDEQTRLLGEIAYQLDKRMLAYVFRGQRRYYGFTVSNIPHKIIEVSTHTLTGTVDEGYRLYLSQRYTNLIGKLQELGFKQALHPQFTEFIVNTYGILKRSPSEYASMEADFNNPDFLKRVILTKAPKQLQKDLLVVLTCLCFMADI